MKHLVVALLMAAVSVAAQDELPIAELQGKAPAQTRDLAAWQVLHRQVLAHYLPLLSVEKIEDRQGPALDYQFICWRAARPGAETERLATCEAIAAALGSQLAPPGRIWLLKILQRIGREESVPALVRLANDSDVQIRDWALRALASNPSPAAAEALATLIANAPADRLVERLTAAPPLPSLIPVLAKHTAAGGDAAGVAMQALGRIGSPEADAALRALSPRSPAFAATRNTARLHCADLLAKAGRNAEATAIYQSLFASNQSVTVRCGALHGLLASNPDKTLDLLRPVLGKGSPRLQGVAADYLREAAPEDTVLAFAEALTTLSVPGQEMLLDVFASRHAVAARPAVLRALQSPEERVRVAAIQALAKLGDASCVPTLLSLVPTEGAVGKEAGTSLRTLVGRGVDDAILAETAKGDDERRLICVGVVIDRRTAGAVPALLKCAKADSKELADEACKGLGLLGREQDLPALVDLMGSVEEKTARRNAGKATLAVARRCPAGDDRTAAMRAALPNASEPAQVALLGVLGELGGQAAFAAVRGSLASPAPALREAALRALGTWPDASPAQTLLDLSRTEADAVQQVLALRGAVRALGQPGAPAPRETVALLQQAMGNCRRDDERKVVLAGLGGVRHGDALAALRPYLEDPALRPEAVAAMLRVAVGIAGEDRALADEYLALVMQHAADGPLRKQAEEARRKIEEFGGFLVNWLIAGPFFKTDERCDMIDMKMGPEGKNPDAIHWQITPQTGDPGTDWQILFENIYGGKDRAAYAVTWIRCAGATPARFEIGSDDGVKVWLDDKVIHTNGKGRPLKPGEDIVDVDLSQGWHQIMLKITQGGGHWAACLRVRTRDGGPLAGCRTLADFRDLAVLRADLAEPAFAGSARRALDQIAACMKAAKQ